MTGEKITIIQILRAIAICAVVLIHTCPDGYWQVIFRPFVNYAVALFVFLSGYLTKIDSTNWLRFYKRRICRVFIPYLIWTIIYTLPCTDPHVLLYNLRTTNAAGMLYYIFVYIQLVIITPVLGPLVRSKLGCLVYIVSPLFLLFTKYCFRLWGIQLSEPLSLAFHLSFFAWLSYYYLGLRLGNQCVCRSLPSERSIKYIILLSLPVQMLESFLWMNAGIPNCGSQTKLSVLLTNIPLLVLMYYSIINSSSSVSNLFTRILKLIGDYSFGIFLVHVLVIRVLKHIPIYNYLPFIFNSILVLSISLCIVVLGHRVLGNRISRSVGLF